ncbi:sedoheptulokinase isoform X2 [Phascolarctos cinereus]|uniref:Sedoheptulokinase n=1 Tax=Phascolarctos cinereus TaxID=38626 RepID=A0A6P5INI7_PHACI|nr:sedoheptulokinase isoform X2 [Phascolarctos cinereus]XP_020820441.1 sedoheptulokinase isoform X2 [Phascolarctos cinereus]
MRRCSGRLSTLLAQCRCFIAPGRAWSRQGQEQDVHRILQALSECLRALPMWQLQSVRGIGVSGQMHGVMFWKSHQACSWTENGPHGIFEPQQVSRLITWQDGRCTNSFLESLPQPESHLSVATGFGSATIYWLSRHSPEFLKPYSAAGTIQDYVVAMLCGLQRPLMSDHNAASWGYFNTDSRSWNSRMGDGGPGSSGDAALFYSLEESGFPTHLLPDVAEAGTIAGWSAHQWFGIPQGTRVGVALGDLQCSVYSCMSRSTDAVLNISTSVQLAASMPPGFKPAKCPDPSAPVAYFPYFNRTYLGVAASLNGGNVLATFVTMLAQWMADLGLDVLETLIYSQMIQTALAQTDTPLIINPTLLGERHLPEEQASVSSISPSNLSLGHVTRALCRGIVQNIHAMLPSQQLKAWGIERVIGSGSALSRNEVLRQEAEKAFPLPFSYGQDVDAAAGAALVMLQESARGDS